MYLSILYRSYRYKEVGWGGGGGRSAVGLAYCLLTRYMKELGGGGGGRRAADPRTLPGRSHTAGRPGRTGVSRPGVCTLLSGPITGCGAVLACSLAYVRSSELG